MEFLILSDLAKKTTKNIRITGSYSNADIYAMSLNPHSLFL